MADNKTKQGGLAGAFANLNERERKGLVFLGFFLPVVFMVIASIAFHNSMASIRNDTQRYKAALDLLTAAGPAYAEKKSESARPQGHKHISEEVLSKNDIKLTSFVAEHAQAVDIDVTSYDEDELPFGKKDSGGPIVVEKQLRVEIRSADMNKLIRLLDRIEKSDEPVFVKRVDVRKHRKKPGDVRAVLTVSTFVKKEQES